MFWVTRQSRFLISASPSLSGWCRRAVVSSRKLQSAPWLRKSARRTRQRQRAADQERAILEKNIRDEERAKAKRDLDDLVERLVKAGGKVGSTHKINGADGEVKPTTGPKLPGLPGSKRVALLVGIKAYSSLSPLTTPLNDVSSVGAVTEAFGLHGHRRY